MILLIDNYDSFVFNLARYFERLGQTCQVVRNDQLSVPEIKRLNPAAIVISPGPCTPNEAGCSLEVIRQLHTEYPTLGVCLGHQAIAAALGGRVVRAAEPMHGRTSAVQHDGNGIFAGLPNPIVACRYHSLVVEQSSLPTSLSVTAWTADGTVMAIAHRELPVIGVQFHPESILTDVGYPLLVNFLKAAKIALPSQLPSIEAERLQPHVPQPLLPSKPVTF